MTLNLKKGQHCVRPVLSFSVFFSYYCSELRRNTRLFSSISHAQNCFLFHLCLWELHEWNFFPAFARHFDCNLIAYMTRTKGGWWFFQTIGSIYDLLPAVCRQNGCCQNLSIQTTKNKTVISTTVSHPGEVHTILMNTEL